MTVQLLENTVVRPWFIEVRQSQSHRAQFSISPCVIFDSALFDSRVFGFRDSGSAGETRIPAPESRRGAAIDLSTRATCRLGQVAAGRAVAHDYDWTALAARLSDFYATLPGRPA